MLVLTSNWNFSLENFDTVWSALLQIGILLVALFVGNFLRNTIPFLRKSLIPSALIGGFLLLGLMEILKIWDITLLSENLMQIITYHSLAIGFIAMTLKTTKAKKKVGQSKINEASLFCGSSYLLQAAVGLLITIVMFLLTQNSENPIYYACGVLLSMGFGQGPGNALTWDVTYSQNELFSGNGSFGLSIASVGFLVASVIGVIYINVLRRKGLIREREKNESSQKTVQMFEGEKEIPNSESVDKFSLQLGFVAIAYGIAFGFMALLGSLSTFTNNLAWGLNFLWGVFAAVLIKAIFRLLQKGKLIKRNYINNYQMDRISGFAFDLMIVAGVASISIDVVLTYALPIILLCLAGTIIQFLYTWIVAKKLFKGYENEFFVMNFGTLTGTASNGMILLKEIDPNLETPTADVYISSQIGNMITCAPLLLLLSFIGNSLNNSIIAMCLFFGLFIIYNIIMFRRSIFRKHYQNKPEEVWTPNDEEEK